jgi:hypothetical protein
MSTSYALARLYRLLFLLWVRSSARLMTASRGVLSYQGKVEAPPGFEPGVEVLQTSALPLGDGAPWRKVRGLKGPRDKPKRTRSGASPAFPHENTQNKPANCAGVVVRAGAG